jgi:hypothetical protein
MPKPSGIFFLRTFAKHFFLCLVVLFASPIVDGTTAVAQTAIADPAGTVVTAACVQTESRSIGLPNGNTYTYSNTNWPSCTAWGIPTTVAVLKANVTSASACTFDNVTFNAAAPTNLNGGVACFTGTTNYYASNGTTYANRSTNIRMIVTVTNNAGTAMQLQNIGGFICASIPDPNFTFKVKVELQAYGPASVVYYTSGTGTTGPICNTAPTNNTYVCANYLNQWVGALQLYNCISTNSGYKICSQFPGTTSSYRFVSGVVPAQPGTPTGAVTVCPSTSVTLTRAANPPADHTYYWQTSPTGTSTTLGSGATLTVAPSVNTTYYVRPRAGTCWGTASNGVAVTMKTLSTAPTAMTSSIGAGNACSGSQSITLNWSGGSLGTGATYRVYSGSCGGTLVGSTAGTSLAVTPAGNTTYFVRAEGDCNTTACASVAVTTYQPACDFIYASTTGNDASNGTAECPVRTLSRALQLVSGSRNYIRMSNGAFTETGIVDLVTGVTVEGGYTVSGALWDKASSPATTITFSGTGGSGNIQYIMGLRSDNKDNWRLQDLTIRTSNSSGQASNRNGISNYAMWIANGSDGYDITRCDIASGNATSGLAGPNGGNGAAGSTGGYGGAGRDACNSGCDSGGGGGGGGGGGAGGSGAATGGAGSSGGAGGNGHDDCSGCNGNNGSAACGTAGLSNGCSDGTSVGGAGGGCSSNGTNGTNGAIGAASYSGGLFNPGLGSNGTAGGGGGGGGGGAGGSKNTDGCDASGNGGSGGGGGGGGGGGAYGGGGGGASFGIFLFNNSGTSQRITSCLVAAGTAGSGGTGGTGGSGGAAGAGGAQQNSCTGCGRVNRGGAGGNGSSGGNGGNGGAGVAGYRYAIGRSGGVDPTLTSTAVTINSSISGGSVPNPVTITVEYSDGVVANSKACINSEITVSKSGSGSWSLASTGLSWVNDQNATSSSYDDNLTTSPKKVYSTTASTWHSISSNGSSYAGFIGVAADNRTLPTLAAIANICQGGTVNLPAATSSWGSPVEYSWTIYRGTTTAGTVVHTSTASNPAVSPALNTPGEHLVKYQERDACCGWSIPVYATFVVFPTAPTLTALSNTCNTALANITAVTAVTGFTAKYAVQAPGGSMSAYGTLAAANALLTTAPGCWTIKAAYFITTTHGSTTTTTPGPAGCVESAINAVVFPAAPTITALSNTCNAALANITAITAVTDFTAEYAVQAPGGTLSSYGTLATANGLLTNTPGCWAIKARYKLTAACGGTAANTTGTGSCAESTINAVVFPAAPTITALANTCNAALANITAVATVTGFTAEYAVQAPGGTLSSYGTLATANGLLTNTPGCWTIKARYKLTAACGGTAANTTGTGSCAESTINAVVFPAAPTITALSNTCNAALADITAVPAVTDFTAEYAVQAPGGSLSAYGTLAAANALTVNTPGCWTIKARYKLTAACGGTAANTTGTGSCAESTINAVVFPAAPTITALSNTCNAALADITAVPAVTDFTAEYAVQAPGGSLSAYGTLAAANALTVNTPGCWTVKARYKLTAACGGTAANTTGTGSCAESTINAVVFPAAPTITALANTCNAALANITAVAAVTDFTAEYAVQAPGGTLSSYGTLATANGLLANTPGCWTIKARYKLTAACGGTSANTTGTGSCAESTINAVVFPLAPVITAPAVSCATAFTLPTVTGITGFTVEYSINGGTYSTSPVVPTSVGSHTVQARYVTTAVCGSTASGTSGTGACGASNTVTAYIVPATINLGFRTWTGMISTAWDNALNWDCGGIPTLSDNVIIPATTSTSNYPVIVNGVIGNTRTVRIDGPPSSVEVQNGGTLNVAIP